MPTTLTQEQINLRNAIAADLMALDPKLRLKDAKKRANQMVVGAARKIEEQPNNETSAIHRG